MAQEILQQKPSSSFGGGASSTEKRIEGREGHRGEGREGGARWSLYTPLEFQHKKKEKFPLFFLDYQKKKKKKKKDVFLSPSQPKKKGRNQQQI